MRATCMIAAGLWSGCSFTGQGQSSSTKDADPIGDAAMIDGVAIDAPPLVHTGRVQLTFDNSASTVDLDNFPVMVKLSDDRIAYAMVSDPHVNLRFTTSGGGSSLKYEVEHWDPAGVSIVWVNVPQILAGSTADHIVMEYGPGVSSSDHDPPNVWTAGYDAVWHFNDEGDALADSRNSHGGAGNATTRDSGMIAGARAFIGIPGGSSIGFNNAAGLFDGLDRFSLELWIRPSNTTTLELNGEPAVMGKSTSMNLGRLHPGTVSDILDIEFQVDWHMVGNVDATLPVNTPGQTWTYVAYSSDMVEVTVFANGASKGTQPAAKLASDSSTFRLGSTSNAFLGRIDELRVGRTARSASWIRAQHRSMTDQFITFTALP